MALIGATSETVPRSGKKTAQARQTEDVMGRGKKQKGVLGGAKKRLRRRMLNRTQATRRAKLPHYLTLVTALKFGPSEAKYGKLVELQCVHKIAVKKKAVRWQLHLTEPCPLLRISFTV
jgi:hypothetical protein